VADPAANPTAGASADARGAGAAPAPGPPANRWKGISQDDRQAERRRLLLDAGFDLLGTLGVAGTTVRGVCETAKLNPRYFYESFADLDALLVAVFDQVSVEALGVMLEAVAACEPEPLVVTRAGVGSFVRFVTDDPRRAQVLFIEGLGNEALARRRLDSMLELVDLFRREAARAQGGEVEEDSVTKVALSLVVGGMAELLITWLQGRLEVTIDELIEDASLLFVALGEASESIAAQRGKPHPPRRAAPTDGARRGSR
jgi:AcrR family transcriptional regulator